MTKNNIESINITNYEDTIKEKLRIMEIALEEFTEWIPKRSTSNKICSNCDAEIIGKHTSAICRLCKKIIEETFLCKNCRSVPIVCKSCKINILNQDNDEA